MDDLLSTRIAKNHFSHHAYHTLIVSTIGPLQVFEKLDANACHQFLVHAEFLCSGVFTIMCHVLLVANGGLYDSRTNFFNPG